MQQLSKKACPVVGHAAAGAQQTQDQRLPHHCQFHFPCMHFTNKVTVSLLHTVQPTVDRQDKSTEVAAWGVVELQSSC